MRLWLERTILRFSPTATEVHQESMLRQRGVDGCRYYRASNSAVRQQRIQIFTSYNAAAQRALPEAAKKAIVGQ
jgi:hypothetical protein